MPFSDTSTLTGLIQVCEDWTGLGNAGISGDTTTLKKFATRINEGFSRIMPLLLSYADHMRWDDLNQTDLPIGTVNLVSGQSDYEVKTDDNSLNILNITDVYIYPSATSTTYMALDRITLDDPLASLAMSPNTTDVGTPTCYLENGNKIFFFPQPNYSATSGIKLFFERDPSYFVYTDTTKTPGIPRPFHGILALYASHDWLLQNKSQDTMRITRLEAQIARRERELSDLISERNPTHAQLRPASITYR